MSEKMYTPKEVALEVLKKALDIYKEHVITKEDKKEEKSEEKDSNENK